MLGITGCQEGLASSPGAQWNEPLPGSLPERAICGPYDDAAQGPVGKQKPRGYFHEELKRVLAGQITSTRF